MVYRLFHKDVQAAIFCIAVLVYFSAMSAFAQSPGQEIPPDLATLQNVPDTTHEFEGDLAENLQLEIRNDAIADAAMSYGARGGLARRTYEIRQELKLREAYMDKTFDFGRLLIVAPSGVLIEPPIIRESIDALIVESDGQSAAVVDAMYNISRNARIVPTPRNWRTYLERDWGKIADPPDILRPSNDDERDAWERAVTKGWEQGYKQADEIFQSDLNRLISDFQGMVRYRMLLAQGMVSQPYALQVDRGITGGGAEMRVGDRAIAITGPSQLKPGTDQWQPASR